MGNLEMVVDFLRPPQRRARPLRYSVGKRCRSRVLASGYDEIHSSSPVVLKISWNSSPVSFVIPLAR